MISSAIETIEFFETYGPEERAARQQCTDKLMLKAKAAKAGLVAVKTDDLPF